MKKKKSSGGGANWMDTYGDMVTLLLCFFVLLYSMSTIDSDKMKAIIMSFNPNATLTMTDPVGGGGPSADGNDSGVMPEPPENVSQNEIDQQIEAFFQAIQSYISESASAAESVSVRKDNGRVYVTFNDAAFFDGDKYDLRPDAIPILDRMCEMLSEHAYAIDTIEIEGHTAQADPSHPNTSQGDRFLASNRATIVVVYIQEHVDWDVLWPGKLVSSGHGQWHPVEDNKDEAGRAKNRRVEMIISGRDIQAELEAGDIPSYSTGTSTSAQGGTE